MAHPLNGVSVLWKEVLYLWNVAELLIKDSWLGYIEAMLGPLRLTQPTLSERFWGEWIICVNNKQSGQMKCGAHGAPYIQR